MDSVSLENVILCHEECLSQRIKKHCLAAHGLVWESDHKRRWRIVAPAQILKCIIREIKAQEANVILKRLGRRGCSPSVEVGKVIEK